MFGKPWVSPLSAICKAAAYIDGVDLWPDRALGRFADVKGYTRKREDLHRRTLLHKISAEEFWKEVYREKARTIRERL